MGESYLDIEHTGELRGSIRIQGSKNAVLPMMAASLLQEGVMEYVGCPRIGDVFDMIRLLSGLGCRCWWEDEVLCIDTANANYYIVDETAGRIRSSVLLLGPLFARREKASLPLPGGCMIGARPYDQHKRAFETLGVTMWESMGRIEGIRERHCAGEIILACKSVGATENALLLSVVTKGTTIIKNAAREPEIQALAQMLNDMGAGVCGAGTDVITVEGVSRLHSCRVLVPGDRIVAGTYAIAAAALGGSLRLCRADAFGQRALFQLLTRMGARVDVVYDERTEPYIRIQKKKSSLTRYSLHVRTEPYPGFPTDLQSALTVLLTVTPGIHTVEETMFENRFHVISELKKMGAALRQEEGNRGSIRIIGRDRLDGAWVRGRELRGTAALGIAGLAAHGATRVYGISHLERGYERFPEDLQQVGARIQRKTET